MRMKRVSANVRELVLDSGSIVLLSYDTPVAIYTNTRRYHETTKKWSSSTSRHLAKFRQRLNISPDEIGQMNQDFFNGLLKGTPLHDFIGNWKYSDKKKYLIRDFNRSIG